MKPTRVETQLSQAVVYSVPTHDGEKILADTVGGRIMGSIVRISHLPIDFGIDVGLGIKNGDYSVLHDCIRHEENGYRRVVLGAAEIGGVEGEEPDSFYELTRTMFIETEPEPENKIVPPVNS